MVEMHLRLPSMAAEIMNGVYSRPICSNMSAILTALGGGGSGAPPPGPSFDAVVVGVVPEVSPALAACKYAPVSAIRVSARVRVRIGCLNMSRLL